MMNTNTFDAVEIKLTTPVCIDREPDIHDVMLDALNVFSTAVVAEWLKDNEA